MCLTLCYVRYLQEWGKEYSLGFESAHPSKPPLACEQALCLGKNSEEREGKGEREPVDKHLRPLFRLL